MSILSNPRLLYFVRIAQLLFGIGFLIVICDAGAHRGWWNNINGPLAVGVIAAIFTFALTLHTLISHHLNKNPFSGGSTMRTILRLVTEVIVFLLWIATAVLMLRPKGGCPVTVITDGKTICPGKGDDFKYLSDQPSIRWDLGVAFDFVEIVIFILSGLLVFREDRATKVTGGASYA